MQNIPLYSIVGLYMHVDACLTRLEHSVSFIPQKCITAEITICKQFTFIFMFAFGGKCLCLMSVFCSSDLPSFLSRIIQCSVTLEVTQGRTSHSLSKSIQLSQ